MKANEVCPPPSLRISLVMATVGRVDEVATFITRLEMQTSRAFELIIVDQNTDDRLVEIVGRAKAVGLDVRHLRFSRRSLSAARNHGLLACRYDIAAIPDDDCWYESNVIANALASFMANPTAAALVGHWVEGESDAKYARQLELRDIRRFRCGPTDSYCLFFRTKVLRRLNGFDERLGVPLWFGSAEETDLVMRLLTEGFSMLRDSSIRIHHPRKWPEDFASIAEVFVRVRGYERAMGAMYLKHRLSLWVTGRGLVAPIIRAALNLRRPKRVAAEIARVCGRVEGLFRWWRTEGRSVSAQLKGLKAE
jgi:glycosyltransferase involved in cell wall biosynthesis